MRLHLTLLILTALKIHTAYLVLMHVLMQLIEFAVGNSKLSRKTEELKNNKFVRVAFVLFAFKIFAFSFFKMYTYRLNIHLSRFKCNNF